MYDLVWDMAERKVNRLRALDPDRNLLITKRPIGRSISTCALMGLFIY